MKVLIDFVSAGIGMETYANAQCCNRIHNYEYIRSRNRFEQRLVASLGFNLFESNCL